MHEPMMVEVRYIRQAGCPSHYAHVRLAVAAGSDAASGLDFQWSVDEETIPAEFAGAVRAGITHALAEVAWVAPLRVAVVGGSYHEVDSQAMDFHIAARRAMHDALTRLAP